MNISFEINEDHEVITKFYRGETNEAFLLAAFSRLAGGRDLYHLIQNCIVQPREICQIL